MSPSEYVQEALRICEDYFVKHLSKGLRVAVALNWICPQFITSP